MFFKDVSSGVGSYGKALKLISKLNLWKFFLIPALIGVIIGAGIVWLAIGFSDDIGDWISKIWFIDWGKETFTTISHWIGGIIVIIIGMVLFKHIVQAFSSPFMGPVSEKVEEYLTGKEIESNNFMILLLRGIKINVRNLFLELFYTFLLFILGFIPILNIVSVILIFRVQAYYAGFGNMDYTLERHMTYNESITFVKRHKGVAVGNGIIFTLMLIIPFIGVLITLPVSTVASTIETLKKLEEEGKVTLLIQEKERL